MDKLKQIESFVSVSTRGSLTAAAHAEGVAPAVVGRRIDAGYWRAAADAQPQAAA